MTFKGVAERIGRKYAMWNANRIRGVLVDDTFKADGRVLMYHAASDRLVYVDLPSGGSPFVTLDGGDPGTGGSLLIDCGDPGSVGGAIIHCGGV
ncbi:hypothetical protein FTO68_06270 [Methanocalculus taiwanensis]|uniref:Uncharacterized protein n=1 Tax=Methanocalculus taiwanensis TaxID=106207 RepID=A0ABD4TMS2_9EURY|nr:hypothetical protein [Methanocalculus taiwanensis]MCQ1538590.1 hypothetical protein [Methanocalculus taiwanensis]